MSTYPRGPFRKYDPEAKEGSKPPHTAGAYRFAKKETGKIFYEGESGDLARRMSQHISTGKLDPAVHDFLHKAADPRSTSATRREVEAAHIVKHWPAGNKRGGGGGRSAKGGSGRRPS